MQPIQDLLNRIKWDKEFGNAQFKLGYWDRIERDIVVVSLQEVDYEHPSDDGFQMTDSEGNQVTIPFHRVRQVYRDGTLIWNRDG